MSIQEICDKLIMRQRTRRTTLGTRIRIVNRLTMGCASEMNYKIMLNEGDTKGESHRLYAEVLATIARYNKGERPTPIPDVYIPIIEGTNKSIQAYDEVIKGCEKDMVELVKQLPIADWMEDKDQAGFGWKSLGVIIGEAGNLNKYANPAKLWRYMGCAPYQDKMPSTWRGLKKLTAKEWEEVKYCPRRRSDLWNIEECLIKTNKTGPYRKRYDQAKAAAMVSHPEWGVCKRCDGTGKSKTGKECAVCEKGVVKGHYHNHAHLLCGKLLLKNLWITWTGSEDGYVADTIAPRPTKQKAASSQVLTPITSLPPKTKRKTKGVLKPKATVSPLLQEELDFFDTVDLGVFDSVDFGFKE